VPSASGVFSAGAVGSSGGAAATVCPDAVAAAGVRSDSLAITIVIAAASTARPASCPPISFGSIGDDEATVSTLVPPCFLDEAALPLPFVGGPELGVIVGNKLERPGGVTVVPGIPGSGLVGGIVTGGTVPGGGLDEELE
jgi:hypothetical protein